jgi:tetratricopeptide (TPR) repeat protein
MARWRSQHIRRAAFTAVSSVINATSALRRTVGHLGNVLRELGRAAEAKLAWQMAVARDPEFAEAWYNLALVSEDEGQRD